MIQWHEFDQRAELDRSLAQAIADTLRGDITTRGAASVAFSGGSTPRGMLEQLALAELDWSAVATTLVDERWVEASHQDSNARLLDESLLRGPARAAAFYPLFTADTDPTPGAAIAEQRLESLTRPFSAVILGMGGDGHTASWFPQAANLGALTDPAQASRVMATEPVTAPHARLTLTLPAVLETHLLVLHITGQDKRDILERAGEANYPVARLIEQQQTPLHIYWAP